KEGRWEVNGGMWVEADCNLTSGESLVRQLLHGKKFFKDEFGATSNCLWLPDVFGYSAAMPQILKKSGIDTFMTTKISWNQYNRIPNDTFNWKGIDGSEVLTHFVTTPEEGGGGWSAYTYNGLVNSFTVNGIWKEYRNKELNNETLLSYGYGDGGGGVNREMLEMIDKLSLVPSNPQITTGTAGEYFDELHEKIKDKKVNKWDGELYLEFHRGTYTSQAKTKKANRKLEYMLRNSEIFSSLYAGNDYPFDLYDATWKKVLTHQFHDILPGSSITEVYADAAKIYKEIEETLGENLNQTAVKNSVSENNVWTVFNFNNFSGEKNIYIKTSKSFNFTDSNQNRLRSQKVREGYLVTVSLQGISSKIIFGEEIQETYAQLNSNIFEINNENYVLKWNEKGYLTSIFDKVQQKEMLKEKEVGNEICMFEDIPRLYDAWELEPYYINKKYPVNKLISSKLIEDGEIEKTVEFVWEIGNSKISQKIVLQNNSRRIDFVTHVNWQEKNKILRTFFPVNVRASKATFDIQFGNIERPTHKNTEWDFAKFEIVGHKWADISQRDSGMALLNNCKYGYSAVESTLGLSLLKSPIAPDKTADIGEHTFI
ncbi:MAG: alpha-mannosidase, partial [Fusobacteriaceae bacterium]